MKISREGIVLIKSFEGFRPRAIRRENGGWVIGYGHTLSAREGATVSESDAELLLRYDLLPVEKSVNDTVPAPLNQHQFDALVSFAFSLGLERFAASDVRAQLMSGAPAAAAEAMMGWPEPLLRESALRRRAAERALFIADPGGPVALSDLLAAPLLVPVDDPEPPVGAASLEPEPTPSPTPEAAEPALPEPFSEETVAEPDARSAAVAALLGEAAASGEPEADAAAGIPAVADSSMPELELEPVPPALADQPDLAAAPGTTTTDGPTADSLDLPPAPQEPPAATEPTVEGTETTPQADLTPRPPAADPMALAVARYAPYSAAMIGPLPYLLPAAPRIEQAEAAPDTHPDTDTGPDAPATVVDPPVEADAPEPATSGDPEPLPEPEPAPAPVAQPELRTISFAPSQPVNWPDATPNTAPAGTLVLTPLQEMSDPAPLRPLWTPEQRSAPEGTDQSVLFEEDLILTQAGGALLRHEVELSAPTRFDWSETGAFIGMGGVGLAAFGASMAAFRLAAERAGGDEYSIVGWVLALVGLTCVGVSSLNLYRRWGLPGGD